MERKLQAFEAAIAETAARRPFNIVGSLRISPPLDSDQLRRALDALQQNHPMLRTHIETRGAGRWLVESGRQPIPLKTLEGAGKGDWQIEVEAELSDQVDPTITPLIRFTNLVAADHQSSDLIFRAHHSILDGVSAQAMVDELLRRLAGASTSPGGKLLTPSPASRYPGQWRTPRVLPAMAAYGGRELVRDVSYQLRNGSSRHRVHPKARSKVLTRSLDHAASERLIRATRRRRISLNSALQAAGLLALAKHQSDQRRQPMQSITFADLRPYLKPPLPAEQLGCAISMLRFGLILDQESSFWDVAGAVHQLISAAASRGDKFVSTHLAPMMMRVLLSQRRMRMASTALSYLGPIKLSDRYGRYQLREIHGFVSDIDIGPVYSALAHIWRGELQWNFAYLDTDWDRRAAEAIADDLLGLLRSALD